MGRYDQLGVSNGSGPYTLLDLFHYNSADGSAGALPGSPGGALAEPFVLGYDASNVSYFSYNGTNVTWQYNTPAEISPPSNEDVADWSTTSSAEKARGVGSDSFDGADTVGVVDPPLSLPDQQEMSVLGYSLKANALCFCRGALIATPFGERLVERLSAGNTVLTASATFAQ